MPTNPPDPLAALRTQLADLERLNAERLDALADSERLTAGMAQVAAFRAANAAAVMGHAALPLARALVAAWEALPDSVAGDAAPAGTPLPERIRAVVQERDFARRGWRTCHARHMPATDGFGPPRVEVRHGQGPLSSPVTWLELHGAQAWRFDWNPQAQAWTATVMPADERLPEDDDAPPDPEDDTGEPEVDLATLPTCARCPHPAAAHWEDGPEAPPTGCAYVEGDRACPCGGYVNPQADL